MFNGYGVSVGDNTKVLGIDSGNDYTTLWMYLMTLNWLNIMLCIFYHHGNKKRLRDFLRRKWCHQGDPESQRTEWERGSAVKETEAEEKKHRSCISP